MKDLRMKDLLQSRIRCSDLEPIGKAADMPDQHSAATEHALIAKIAEPLGTLPDDPLAIVSVEFPIALRGYYRFAVDAYVERTSQLVAELQATRSPEAAVRRALERVGEEISGILTRAHDTADEITKRSRAEAEERLEAARHEAVEITARAERRVKELDAETERIWAERHSIVTDAQGLARRLTELAESALERFPADATIAEATVEEAPAALPAHPFDGAAPDSDEPVEPADILIDPAEGESTAEEETAERQLVDQPTVEHEALEQRGVDPPIFEEPPIFDEPTVALPPLEPWEERPLNPPWSAGEGPAGSGDA
jgi:cell division septum initiation protein DivIVA